MTHSVPVSQSAPLTLGEALERARACYENGQPLEAERLIDAILREHPANPDANHLFGVLALRSGQPVLALYYFREALEAELKSRQYWLSYLHALCEAGLLQSAREVAAIGARHGVSGVEFAALTARAEGHAEIELRRNVPDPDEVMKLLELFGRGRFADVISISSAMAAKFPTDGFSWKVLGTALTKMARGADALMPMRKAVGLMPDDAEARSNLGYSLIEAGRFKEAEVAARRALAIKPDFIDAQCNLGVALGNLGRLAEAEKCFRIAVENRPDLALARGNLANNLKDQGRFAEAESFYLQALSIDPNSVQTHSNLGNLLRKSGRLEEAKEHYLQALQLNPDFSEALNNFGNLLNDLGQFEEAEQVLRRALSLKPSYADAYNNLGNALKGLGRMDAARASYVRALEFRPNFAEAHSNLGAILKELGLLEEADECYRRALEANPGLADVHSNRGHLLQDLGRIEEALLSNQKALQLEPASLEYAIRAKLVLPVIADSRDSLDAWRGRYDSGIEQLQDIENFNHIDDPATRINTSSFYLAYDNRNNLQTMRALCRLFRSRLPGVNAVSPHIANWRPPEDGERRIRVGVLSELLVEHTIGRLFRGIVEKLDRVKFEVVVIHTPKARRDEFSQAINAVAEKVLVLPSGLKNQQDAVSGEKLDALFYPDIGMSPCTYFLAFSRLAPVQAVGWGHPDTTGIDTVDYFVSASNLEPEGAQEYYSESLIRLSRLPCFYHSALVPTEKLGRADLGLPEAGTLYGCPQSLFKFHPDFDRVMAEIAEGDPNGHIVLLEGKYPSWTSQLRARWARSAPILLKSVVFLPYLSHARFLALLGQIDVLLDPLYFGSGNTLYEAIQCGTPIVTCPGRFMRARVVYGAYRQLEMADAPVASSLVDYAPMALALGRDAGRRSAFREACRKNRHKLFDDTAAVREFEGFLESAVQAAGSQGRL